MVVSAVVIVPVVLASRADETPNLQMYGRIRDEGTARSRALRYATELSDDIGARLTGSPNLERAIAWVTRHLTEIGLSGVRTESWGEFGMGWRQRNVWLRLVEPDTAPFIAQAAPWSPATNGRMTADAVMLHGSLDQQAIDAARSTLRGKILLLGSPPAPVPIEQPLFERLTDAQLADAVRQTADRDDAPELWEKRFANAEHFERTGRWLAAAGVRAAIVPSANDAKGGVSGGTIYADTNYTFGWYVYQRAHAMSMPLIIAAAEHFGRVKRLLERGVPVKLELNVDTEVTGDHQEGFNVFAEIPGVDAAHRDEVVMVTAHLDSWTAGTGATDDGAGVAIAIEAMRILRALQVKPRRTVRLALWTGEEQGALGSRAYIARHLATVPRASTAEQVRVPELWRRRTGPIVVKPAHAGVSAVYNLDAGGGRIRGVSLSRNAALRPIFEKWMAPLRDLGVSMVAAASDCGGDCRGFEEIGIPTPSFKQDPLDYHTRTHHTNMDTPEHLLDADLQQASIVVATMLYNTAMYETTLPRLPLPR